VASARSETGTPRRAESAAKSAVEPISGYRFIRCTSTKVASTTPGRGSYGFSFDDNLKTVMSSRGVGGLPGTYAGIASTLARGVGLLMDSTLVSARRLGSSA
jgi:hypothetical protein